jgi:glycosyltransferase involved in cell wall biosynthesis
MTTSINLTIHNKGFLLRQILHRIAVYTSPPYELVCVLDGCTDDSAAVLDRACRDYYLSPKILVADNVFETKANNLAARASTGDTIIIVQDDCLIDEPGWNERLLKSFAVFSDVFAVTGCVAHNWAVNPQSEDIGNDVVHLDRWCDILQAVDCANQQNTERETFAVRDTVNRSPLAINHADLETMGYFDETFAPQDCDDHDLMYRMHGQIGKVCGMVPVRWWSKPEWGGTRATGGLQPWHMEAHHKNVRRLYRWHRKAMEKRTVENRRLP